MTKLLCSFLVVPSISFKRIETNSLGDSAICHNRFELIIFAILFLKCVAATNFSRIFFDF